MLLKIIPDMFAHIADINMWHKVTFECFENLLGLD